MERRVSVTHQCGPRRENSLSLGKGAMGSWGTGGARLIGVNPDAQARSLVQHRFAASQTSSPQNLLQLHALARHNLAAGGR